MTNQASQTSKIELLDPEDATGDTARYFEATREFLGRIPNSALALANTPYIARFYLPFNATLQREGMGGLLTCRIKEIVVLKTSFVNACAY